VLVGTAVTFTATVSSASSGAPTGSVTFSDASGTLGTAVVNGQGLAAITSTLTTGGSFTVTAAYSGDANFAASSGQLSATVTVQDAGISGPTTLSTSSGSSATAMLQITPIGGFTGTVNLACTGLPEYSSCQFTPQQITLNGGTAPASVTLTISTSTSTSTASSSAGRLEMPNPGGRVKLPWQLWIIAILSMAAAASRKRRMAAPVFLALAISFGIGLSACAGRSGSSTHSASKTPPGTYSISVVETNSAGKLLNTLPITFAVSE
jgi:Bacterial Ig-like domain (group 3)